MSREKTYETLRSLSRAIRCVPFKRISVVIELHGSQLDFHMSFNDVNIFRYKANGDEIAARLYKPLRDMSCEILTRVTEKYQGVDMKSVDAVTGASELIREDNNIDFAFYISLNVHTGRVFFDYSCNQYNDNDENNTNCYGYAISYDSVPRQELSELIADIIDDYRYEVDEEAALV